MNRKKIFFITLFSTFILAFFFSNLIVVLFLLINNNNLYNYWVVSIVVNFLANAVVSLYLLNSSKRHIHVKLSWVIVVNLLPFLGITLYLIFGIIPLKVKNRAQIQAETKKMQQYENYAFTTTFLNTAKNAKYTDLAFCYNYGGWPIYAHNQIQIVHQNDLFATTLKLIRSAKQFIHLNYYIISDSLWFFFLIDELINSAKKGVQIKFIYDWAGSYKRFSKFNLADLRKNGIQVYKFNPEGFNKYTSITNFRSHRKLLLVDNYYCLTGGSNIGDEYLNLKKDYGHWNDLNFLLEGEIVHSLNLQFQLDLINYTNFTSQSPSQPDLTYQPLPAVVQPNKPPMVCQAIHSAPEFDIQIFKLILVSKINLAQKRLWIYSPYFLLPDEVLEQLIFAAIKGIDVKIILPAKFDNSRYVLLLQRSYYQKLLEANVQIYEYCGFLHTKAIIIDDEQVVIGTNNMDFRSLIINYESSIAVLSKAFNKTMSMQFCTDLANSNQITLQNLHTVYKFKSKFFKQFLKVTVPLL